MSFICAIRLLGFYCFISSGRLKIRSVSQQFQTPTNSSSLASPVRIIRVSCDLRPRRIGVTLVDAFGWPPQVQDVLPGIADRSRSMAMRTRCPGCKKVFKLQESFHYTQMKCPSCKELFRVLTLEEYEDEEAAKAEMERIKAQRPRIIRKKRKYLKVPLDMSDRPDLKKLKSHVPKRRKGEDRGKHPVYGIETLSIGDFNIDGLTLIQARKFVYGFFNAVGLSFKWKSMREGRAKKGFLEDTYAIYLRPIRKHATWVSINHETLLQAGKDRYRMRDSHSGPQLERAWEDYHELLHHFKESCAMNNLAIMSHPDD